MEARKNSKNLSRFSQWLQDYQVIGSLVVLIFFIVWCDLVINLLVLLPSFLVIPVSLGLPFLLLTLIVQYKNKWAYAMVIAACFICLPFQLVELPDFVLAFWRVWEGQAADCSCVPQDEIRNRLLLGVVSSLGISLMHNWQMVEKYQWEATTFYWVIVIAGGTFVWLHGLRLVFYFYY